MQTGKTGPMPAQPNNVVHLRRDAAASAKPKTEPRRRRSFGKVTKMRSGRFQASYVVDGVRHLAPVTFSSRGDAGAWLDMRHAELLEHRWKPPAPPEPDQTTLRAYSARWLDTRRNRRGEPLKPRTKALYEGLLDSHILPAFGDYTLPEITPDMIDDWHADLLPEAPTRRAHAYSLLSSMMRTAATGRRRLIDVNPCQIPHAAKADRTFEPTPATPAQVRTIADNMPDRLRSAVLLAAWGGLRYGELAELRRGDVLVDGDALAVRVARAVTWLKGRTIVGTPKSSAGRRTVNLPPSLRAELLEHLEKHTGPEDDALLFPAASDAAAHLHPSSLMKPYRRAREAAGRPDLRWHDLRHTAATTAAQTGASLRELMQRMGHSTTSAALVYQHVAAERDKAIAAGIDALINPQPAAKPKTRRKTGTKATR